MVSSGEIHFAEATPGEKEWAAGIMAGSDPWLTLGITIEQCRTNCFDPEFSLYIAHVNRQPCGMILIDPKGIAGSPYIKSIAVQHDFRGRGVGQALIGFAESLFQNKSRHLFMCVSSFNTRARSLYERLGFRKVGEFEDYIVNGKSEILLCKRLR